MYTQCPDCGTAFRVTAEVLKQAAGKVRCGGCANAFNALEYLSEKMPEKEVAQDAEPQLPELKPEPVEVAQPDPDLPESISSEQSAALLKTLDQLAGSDIRIEDTGVEWRVLDEDEGPSVEVDEVVLIDDQRDATSIDEVLEESPTPVDEFLTSTPEIVDSPEIFGEEANAAAKTPVEELRFDDNTPLPEDFGFEDEQPAAAEVAAEPQSDPEPDPEPESAPQPDIALSDPHEWTDILDEFEELAEEVATPLDAELDALLDDEETDEDEVEDEEEDVEEPDFEDADVEDVDTQLDLIDEPDIESHTIEEELEEFDEAAESEDFDSEHYVPPMTEEEQTVNMQIDQELFALAVEDEDGFTSTMVIPEEAAESAVEEKKEEGEANEADDEGSKSGEVPGFETIIMEGEFIRSAMDKEKLAADAAAAAELQDAARRAEAEAAKNAGGRRYGMIAGVVGLILLLLVQVVHHSREALAKVPAFNSAVGPVYRAFGAPLQPDWDVTGWRIEASNGTFVEPTEDNSGEGVRKLAYFSRIGNQSEEPLPYPVLSISLLDRFQDVLGATTLDPVDYLPADTDPRKLVEPGVSFEASATFEVPSLDASGFKVIPCYRAADNELRCAIGDFK